MGCETKLWLVVLLFFLSVTYVLQVLGDPQVPCLFILGDSLSDSGNNNNLTTDAKVNYLPYGIDFPDGPTGRFTNGRTQVDFITEHLGFDHFIPPFANLGDSDILEGVNYASGGAGIRDETGIRLGHEVSMGTQLKNHEVIVSQIAKKLGSHVKAKKHLNKCLYYVNVGSNDYLNNYFLPDQYPSKGKYTPTQYAAALVKELSMQLRALHLLGARKFALIGLNLIGCIPHEVRTHGKNDSSLLCVEEESKAAILFNKKLKAVVGRFNKELSDSKFIYIDSAVITSHYPAKLVGIEDFVHCCKVGSNGQCAHGQEEPCKHRDLFAFFDEFHPTEVINRFSARMAFNAPIPSYAYPMDISHLVKL